MGAGKGKSKRIHSKWPVRHLTEADKTKIRQIAKQVGQELKLEISAWPKNSCGDTSFTLLQALRKQIGNPGFRWNIIGGYFNDKNHSDEQHKWIQIADGTIIDPTAGQFLGGQALRIFPPSDPRYLLKPSWDF